MRKSCRSSGVEHVLGKDVSNSESPIKYSIYESRGIPSVPSLSPSVPVDSGISRGKSKRPKKIRIGLPMGDNTTLYRFYSSSNELLYVGISLSVLQRLCQHKSNVHWYWQINGIDLEHFYSRAEALKAEALAIKSENPKFNKQGTIVPEFREKYLGYSTRVVVRP